MQKGTGLFGQMTPEDERRRADEYLNADEETQARMREEAAAEASELMRTVQVRQGASFILQQVSKEL